jgi:hypothetical protein
MRDLKQKAHAVPHFVAVFKGQKGLGSWDSSMKLGMVAE